MSDSIINPVYPYTYGRMWYAVKRLKEKYAGLIDTVCVSRSTQGRCIPVLSLGLGERKILAVASIHGREYVSTGYILLCVEEYARAFCNNTKYCGFDVRRLLEDFTFQIVPMANPDSVEIALGRCYPCVRIEDFNPYFYKNNANNVNINANFPFEWHCVPRYRQGGSCAGSESETKFLMKLCEKYAYEKMLSFHSRGDCLYWRDEGNGEVEMDKAVAQRLQEVCGFSMCKPTSKAEDYAGGFENWFRYKYRKPAICVELIKDENAPFDICCCDFYNLTRWEQTECAMLCVCNTEKFTKSSHKHTKPSH
ncbi:MAG: hypothetical protein IJ298_01375 [Ruminococcus sp.]|nr:hypothetical protein [Ruminococcus sp.]